MPKLGIFSGAEIRKILEGRGYTFIRQRGSHMILQRKESIGTITVPIPVHREVKIGTLQSIIRQSGVSKDLFIR
jgi:predicted RNA binding protein YcfA (HicA-like mRNA interferase family)